MSQEAQSRPGTWHSVLVALHAVQLRSVVSVDVCASVA